jgi:hypothetical protein
VTRSTKLLQQLQQIDEMNQVITEQNHKNSCAFIDKNGEKPSVTWLKSMLFQ